MISASLLEEAKELEAHVGGLLSKYDVVSMSAAEQQIIGTLKHQLVDMRLDARDYEYAETRAVQQEQLRHVRPRLESLHQNILKASEYDLFGAVDTAHISARLQHIMSQIV